MPLDVIKIKKKVNIQNFIGLIKRYKSEEIECTEHTFFRLSEKQRKIFTCRELKDILLNYVPFLVGIQKNDNYAVFYKHNSKNLKVILAIEPRKVKIVTFYYILEWQIPRI